MSNSCRGRETEGRKLETKQRAVLSPLYYQCPLDRARECDPVDGQLLGVLLFLAELLDLLEEMAVRTASLDYESYQIWGVAFAGIAQLDFGSCWLRLTGVTEEMKG